jgi:hypothetical protein
MLALLKLTFYNTLPEKGTQDEVGKSSIRQTEKNKKLSFNFSR